MELVDLGPVFGCFKPTSNWNETTPSLIVFGRRCFKPIIHYLALRYEIHSTVTHEVFNSTLSYLDSGLEHLIYLHSYL